MCTNQNIIICPLYHTRWNITILLSWVCCPWSLLVWRGTTDRCPITYTLPSPVTNLINNNPMDIDMDMDMYMKVGEGRTTCQRTSATATAKNRGIYQPKFEIYCDQTKAQVEIRYDQTLPARSCNEYPSFSYVRKKRTRRNFHDAFSSNGSEHLRPLTSGNS